MNVAGGTLEGLALFVGPTIAAGLLGVVGPSYVVAVAGVAALGGLMALTRIVVATEPSGAVRRSRERPAAALLDGLAELRRHPDVAVIIGCFVAQLFVRGVLGVLAVAASFELIHLGDTGVGWLSAAAGIGGILGAMYAVTLTGRRRLARPFSGALVLWGAPIAVIGIAPRVGVALAALVTIGVGNAVLDVSGFSLVQRLGVDRNLGRIFGAMFTFGITMGALGSLIAPALTSSLGLRPVLVLVGALLPLLALTLTPRFHTIDLRSEPPTEVLTLLIGLPLLSPLPPTTLEKLAARSTMREARAGETVIVENEPGDRFYVIADGEVDVRVGGRSRATLGRGEQFGEIALLREVARTATVVAIKPTRLVTFSGRDFTDAMLSSEEALAIAWRTTDDILTRNAMP
jgi:hypothetical protein